jgi:hypothetical protein
MCILKDDLERAAIPWDNAENTYGAFLSTAMKYGLFKAFTRYGVMMATSWMAQCIFCYYMYTAVVSTCEEYDEDAGNDRWRVPFAAWECIESGQACQSRGLMQLASVSVFLCLMLNNWPLLIKATCIIFDAEGYYGKGQLEARPILKNTLYRWTIFCLAVLSEVIRTVFSRPERAWHNVPREPMLLPPSTATCFADDASWRQFVAWIMLIWAGVLMIFASQVCACELVIS